MFGRPRGLFGRLGGMIMAHSNRCHAAWAIGLLDVQPGDAVLEIGFGPGVAIELLSPKARHVVGIDPSSPMLHQAMTRNARAISECKVELRLGSADRLPFADASFDRVLSVNSMQVWPDALAGLRETARVLRHRGRLALAFTMHPGQQREGVPQLVAAAGFADCRVAETEQAFCVIASVP